MRCHRKPSFNNEVIRNEMVASATSIQPELARWSFAVLIAFASCRHLSLIVSVAIDVAVAVVIYLGFSSSLWRWRCCRRWYVVCLGTLCRCCVSVARGSVALVGSVRKLCTVRTLPSWSSVDCTQRHNTALPNSSSIYHQMSYNHYSIHGWIRERLTECELNTKRSLLEILIIRTRINRADTRSKRSSPSVDRLTLVKSGAFVWRLPAVPSCSGGVWGGTDSGCAPVFFLRAHNGPVPGGSVDFWPLVFCPFFLPFFMSVLEGFWKGFGAILERFRSSKSMKKSITERIDFSSGFFINFWWVFE